MLLHPNEPQRDDFSSLSCRPIQLAARMLLGNPSAPQLGFVVETQLSMEGSWPLLQAGRQRVGLPGTCFLQFCEIEWRLVVLFLSNWICSMMPCVRWMRTKVCPEVEVVAEAKLDKCTFELP